MQNSEQKETHFGSAYDRIFNYMHEIGISQERHQAKMEVAWQEYCKESLIQAPESLCFYGLPRLGVLGS
jgi:hypothetical protein